MAQTQTEDTAIRVENLLETAQFEAGQPKRTKMLTLAGVKFIQLTIKKGDELPGHHVNKSAFALLVRGKAQFTISNQTYGVSSGTFLEIPKDAEHSVIAEEDCVFLVGIIGS